MAEAYELNLRDYCGIFIKRRRIILFTFLLVLLGTIAYTNFQKPVYKSSILVKIEPAVGLNDLFPERYYYWRMSQLPDYERQIVGLPILEKALAESGLLGEYASAQDLKDAVNRISGSITTKIIKETNMISIELTSHDPREAAVILNKIIDVFRSENIKVKNAQVRSVREFIEKQLEMVSAKLKESDDRIKELTLKGVGGLAISITRKITELESRRADLLTKFTELHPDVVKINEQIVYLKNELESLPDAEFEFSNLKRDVSINEKLYNLLKERLQETRIKESEKIDNVILVSPAAVPVRPFSPNRLGNYILGISLGLLLGFCVGLLYEHLDTSIGKIEDLESITKLSVIGVIPYIVEKDKEIKIRKRIKKGKQYFGSHKKVELLGRLQSRLVTAHEGHSVYVEAFRILGANIQVIFGEENRIKGKCILITSSNPQEGKSIIASNLSIIMAQMGYKTVLVDADLRRSVVHRLFGIDSKDKGVTDCLSGKADLASVVKTTTDLLMADIDQDEILRNPWIDNFNLITSGTTFPNSSYLLNTEKMNWFLKTLRDKYDVIILDSSPVLAVSDTSIIVPKIDGVVFVYKAGVTSRMALRRAKVQVESAKDSSVIKGIVLNNVTPEVNIDNYYYYYRGRYYSEAKES